MLTVAELLAFEDEVARRFDAGEVKGPIHLSNGNESELIQIFKWIKPQDWVFSTWRAHYHALLKGVPRDTLMAEITEGRSLNLKFPEFNFFTSAIVGGCLPIAVGVAGAIKRKFGGSRVWCFVGDMAASAGAFHDALNYAEGHDLPITFVVEDNGVSVTTSTSEAWGRHQKTPITTRIIRYRYQSKWPHWGTKQGRAF